MSKYSDELAEGEKYAPLVLQVASDLNRQFVMAMDGDAAKYAARVHPGLVFCFSSITQSPSFVLRPDMAAVGAKFETIFERPIHVGDVLTYDWTVVKVYERRARLYQIAKVDITNQDGDRVMVRHINNTFIGGEYLQRRVAWEKTTGHRRALSISEFPTIGFEIVGSPKTLSIEKMRHYSGGLPGPEWPDRNIHTDRAVSIRSGVGKPIASGLMFDGYLADLMGAYFSEEEWETRGAMKAIAIDMAAEDAVLVPKAIPKPDPAGSEAGGPRYSIWCEDQFAHKVMVGSAELREV